MLLFLETVSPTEEYSCNVACEIGHWQHS